MKPAPEASGFKTRLPARAPSHPSTSSNRATRFWPSWSSPGLEKNELQIQAKENTIRICGKKVVNYPEGSVHRRERVFGDFDRTISLPVQLDPDGIKAEYRDGLLALFLPRSERENPRTIKVS